MKSSPLETLPPLTLNKKLGQEMFGWVRRGAVLLGFEPALASGSMCSQVRREFHLYGLYLCIWGGGGVKVEPSGLPLVIFGGLCEM